MKKTIAIAVVLLLIVFAAAPWLIGTQVESTTKQEMAKAEQYIQRVVNTTPYLTGGSVQLESYDRHYLNASAKTRLRFDTIVPTESGELWVIDIPLNSEITHGPYLGEGKFGLARVVSRPDITQMELSDAIKPDTFTVEDVIAFSGELNETVTMLPVKHTAENGATLEFAGIKAQLLTTIRNRMNFSGDIAIDAISVADPASNFKLKPFKFEMEGSGDSATLAGEYKISSGKIEGAADSGFEFSIAEMNTAATYAPAKNTSLTLSDQKMALQDVQFSNPAALVDKVMIPELSFAAAVQQGGDEKLNFSANYGAVLDASSLAALQLPVDVKTASLDMKLAEVPAGLVERYLGLVGELAAMGETEPSDEQALALQEKMIGMLQEAINKAVAASVGVKLTNDDGRLETELDLSFSPQDELTQEEVLMLIGLAEEDPAALLEIVSGKGYLHLDKSVTDKAQLTPMVQMMGMGLVELQGDAFKSELLIKEGQLLVNGQPIPLFAAGMGGVPEADNAGEMEQGLSTEEAQ